MTCLKSVLAATIVSVGMIGGAAAMPAANLGATAQLSSGLQDARWVCGPYRCRWRPNYYDYYGPRWGWHRGWRRW